MSNKNPHYFYPETDFAFLSPLKDNFEIIRDELLELLHTENKWLETFPAYVESEQTSSWEVFTFRFFSMNHPNNREKCPKTSAIISSIPEIISCDYSRMKGLTKILPHKGYTRMVLRGHLPLIVPKGELCGIQVGNKTRIHQEGEFILFDDSFEHHAWNESQEERIVLMFDFPNPYWNYSAQEISAFKIGNIDDPFLLSLATQEEWNKAFSSGILPV